MRIDQQLVFIDLPGLSMVGADGVAIPSTNTIDLLGQGVGTAPSNIIGNVALFGEDVGVGGGFGRNLLQVTVGTAFTTGNAATLNVALQLAPDTAVTFLPGTWQTVEETGAMTAAQLTAGATIARLDWAPVFPATLRPRYARLLFSPAAATHFTAGTIQFAGVVPMRDDQANKQAANNFVVA